MLGQAGKGIGVFNFLQFDPCRCKLGLDEAEPNMRFLLIVGQSFTWEVAAAATGEVQSSQVMFARLEKVGKVQRFVGHSSHEELKLEATVGQKNGQIDEGVASLEQNKNQ